LEGSASVSVQGGPGGIVVEVTSLSRVASAALKALNAVIDEDEAAARAIIARTSNRYGADWLQRKLKIARDARHDRRDARLSQDVHDLRQQ
jgi:hypothetical protein